MAKKKDNAKDKIVDEPKEQHVSLVKSGRGKGFRCYGDQVVNVLKKLKKDVMPRKTRSLTIIEETVIAVEDTYNEWGQKLKGPAVEDPTVQSLLGLRKGSKASKLESLRQKKQPIAGEGLSASHNKYHDSSDNDIKSTINSSCPDTTDESANDTDDADESDMDLSVIIQTELMMLQGLYKFVDAMGGYMNVTFNDNWYQVAKKFGLAYEHHETVKEVYKEYIGMVKVYYEEAKRSKLGEPRDVAVNCRGTAERPQVSAKTNAEVEEMPDETPRKKSMTEWEDVNMKDVNNGGNYDETNHGKETSTSKSEDFIIIT
nr:bulb-type lectin domain-containing protein [Tanacetum cinerariifolium]